MLRRVFRRLHSRDAVVTEPVTPLSEDDHSISFQIGVGKAGLEISKAPGYSSNFARPSHAPKFGVIGPATGPSATLELKENGQLGLTILYEPPPGLAPAVDIVFVHGLTGNSYNTWCYSNELDGIFDVHWPEHLLKVDIPDARILSFGYDADVVGLWNPASNNRVANHAENLLGDVTRLRERTNSEDRSLIFVMHSLGGLVVQSALDLSRCSPEPHLRRLESKTLGLLFMGTPNFGSNKAKWGNLFATMLNLCKKTNKSIVRILQPDSELLALIQKKFHEILRLRQIDHPIQITCFYEELSLPVVGTVVDMKSAVIPGYPSYGIHSNHMGMVRFQGLEDKGYESVAGELIRWCKAARESHNNITELQEECLRCLYFDGLDSREESITPPLPQTFSWIWDEKSCAFPTWLEHGRGLYLIQGRASSGKSTLVKHIANTAHENVRLVADRRVVVLAYYIDSKNPNLLASTLEGIIRALLWKILHQDTRFFEFILPHFEEMKRSRPNFEWKPSVLQKILSDILSRSSPQPIWMFLDGLDEYSGDLLDIADIINGWAAIASDKVRICISSRPEQELLLSMRPSIPAKNHILNLEQYTRDDITKCATQEIERVSDLLGSECCEKLIASVSAQANGLFMWVKLASRDLVRSCIKGTTVDYEQLLVRLDNLPKEVNELYLQILQRRAEQADYDEALVMLGIVAFGQRIFTLREFSFILFSTDNSNDNSGIRRRIDACTGGLLDYQNRRVVFSHGTVLTFARNLLNQEPDSVILCDAHKRLSQACLNILRTFEQPKIRRTKHSQSGPEKGEGVGLQGLRNYAVQHWLHHTTYPAMKHAYHCKTIKPPSIQNGEFIHWQRCYLARCWEDSAGTAPRSSDPISTTLACLLLIVTPLSIFSSDYHAPLEESFDYRMFDPYEMPRHRLRSAPEWINADVNLLVTLELTKKYTVSFHADDILKGTKNSISAIISQCKGPHQHLEQQYNWFRDILHSSSSSRPFGNLITLHPCTWADFAKGPKPKKKIMILDALLNQIRVVLWHFIQMNTTEDLNLCVSVSRKTMDWKQDDTLSFATPVHYAAFFGLDLVIEELHRYGADIAHFSEESRYGSPLIAAIWGISERRSAMDENAVIQTLVKLDKTRKSMITSGNAGHLGKVTPLNAAVKLYTSYRRRIGLGSEDLMEVISFLLDEGAVVDPGTRAIVRANPELGRYFATTTKPMFTSSVSSFASSAPIKIPSPRSLRSPSGRGNATIGGFGNTNISGLMPYGPIVPGGPGGHRIIQTVEERF
ncbi:hypothetical protein F5Y19DRAFT_210212 [Xylariaceae sp. FL1651]|nr:hypothetical protein F5Y19DRAFT_210212 [Xylariaceae sp. FL1651]